MDKHLRTVLPPLPTAPVIRIVRPFQAFAENKAAGGMLLLFCAVAALIWANSPWSESYARLWHTNLSLGIGNYTLNHDLHFWVNDLLMAIFFFVVGLEIKREILVGELSSFRQAALPVAAALGGVLVPALLYILVNAGSPGAAGWGIPMATDIAFALGVLALLGERIPLGLKVFLTALAIVDDIAAVLVIAVFYTPQINWIALSGAAACIFVLFVLGRLGSRSPLTYVIGGVVLWLLVFSSGIHATVAGVALAFAVPARTPLDFRQFVARSRAVLDHGERFAEGEGTLMTSEEQQACLHGLEEACEKVQPPLHRMEHALHPWVTYVIMPVFALANAGVSLSGDLAASLSDRITLGVILGLLFGKPLGIFVASRAAVAARIASLPAGVTWAHVHAAGWLGGIGFTMSLFVAGLAFTDAPLLNMSKLGVMAASLCAGVTGFLLLFRLPPQAESGLGDSESAAAEMRPTHH